MKKYHLTQTQYDELLERKRILEEKEIPKSGIEIEKAREFGDLSENAEYQAAKELNASLLQELDEIKHKLNNAVIIKAKQNSDKVDIGHTVTLLFKNENRKLTFTLIGENGNGIDEVDIESKLGSAVLGKKINETFSYEANDPALGELFFEVLSIK